MRKSVLFFISIVFLVQIVAWVPALSRPLITLNHHTSSQLSGTSQSPESLPAHYIANTKLQESQEIASEATSYRGINEVGSRPPNCEHRCSGCTPCVATQIPTVSGHFGVQYANYEPISWKCKCGPSVYSP